MQGVKDGIIDLLRKMPRDASFEMILDEIHKLVADHNVAREDDVKSHGSIDLEMNLRQGYPGKYVALVNDAVIETAESLRKLHEKLKTHDLHGQECLIRFIETGASIYETGFL